MVPAADPPGGGGAGPSPCCTISGLCCFAVAAGSFRCRPGAACAAVLLHVLSWSLTLPVPRTVTEMSGFLYSLPFNGAVGQCTGAVLCGHHDLPLGVRGSMP